MFKTQCKIAWRNLWKHKWYSLINIGGLAIGLTGFFIVLLYRHHLTQYDAWTPAYKHVYEVALVDKEHKGANSMMALSPYLLPVLQQQCPTIAAATRVNFGYSGKLLRIGQDKFYEPNIIKVDSSFFDVFPFTLREGSTVTALQQLNGVVISDEFARKHFGNTDPVGKVIRFDEKRDYIITGVMNPLDGPSSLHANLLVRIEVPNWAGWGNLAYNNYVKLVPSASITESSTAMTHAFLGAAYREMQEWMKWPKSLDAFMDTEDHARLHLYPIGDVVVMRMKIPLMVLSLLALVILAVACINFTNLNIANANTRGKEIGVRKVMGAGRPSLTRQFLLETFLQCFTAMMLSLMLAELMLPAFNRLVGQHLTISSYLPTFSFGGKVLLTLILVTLTAGLYPAFYMSAFMPVKVLKGNFSRGKGGMQLRKSLLGFQFAFSIAFVIALAVMTRQMNFMRNFDSGFQAESVVYISNQEKATSATDHYDVVKSQLLAIPNVQKVSRADFVPWYNDGTNSDQFGYNGTEENVNYINIDEDYFAVLGSKIIEGRSIDNAHPNDTANAVVVNEATVKALHIPEPVVGRTIVYKDYTETASRNMVIVGVVKNFMIEGFESAIKPILFLKRQPFWFDFTVVRFDPAHEGEVMQHITTLWKKAEPDHPIIYNTLMDGRDKQLDIYIKLQKITSVFSVFTILIAMIGLLALVAYNVQRRTKEIGIRKVLGASFGDVLQLINKEFAWMVTVANLAAFGIAYLLMKKFLNFFVYRIDMPWLVYLAAGAGAVTITSTIVCLRAWRVAKMNPMTVLKYE